MSLAEYITKAGNAIKGTPREINVGSLDRFIVREGGLLGNGGLVSALKNNKKTQRKAVGGAAGLASLMALLGIQNEEE